MNLQQRQIFFELKNCLKEIQNFCENFNESKLLDVYLLIQKCAINLTAFLNE